MIWILIAGLFILGLITVIAIFAWQVLYVIGGFVLMGFALYSVGKACEEIDKRMRRRRSRR